MCVSSVAGFIFVCVFILKIIYAQVRKRKNTQAVYTFRKQACLVKRAAEKISEDRENFENSVLTQHYNFQTSVFKQIESTQPLIQESLCSSLQRYCSAQNKKVDEIFGSLEFIRKDVSALKDQLQTSLSHQNAGKQEKYHDFGVTANILIEVKEDFKKLISAKRSEEKERFRIISEFLGQSQIDIRQEMALLASAVDGNEISNEESFKVTRETTLDRLEGMKKNLISAYICLDRQRSEMGKLQQAVLYFDHKVKYFVTTSHKFVKQKQMADSSICTRLEECETAYASLIGVIDRNAESLKRQSKTGARTLSRLKNMLAWNDMNLDNIPLPVSEQLGRCSVDTTSIENVDVLKEKLDTFLHAVKSNGEQLESLERTSKSFDQFNGLIKSMTRSYNALLRVLLSPQEKPQMIRCDPKIKVKREEEAGKNKTEACDKIGDSFRKSVEVKEHFSRDIKWEEMAVKFQNLDKEVLPFLLKDIMRIVRNLFVEGQTIPGDISEIDIQDHDYKQWGHFPSESLLTDVSSEVLMYSSDESTGRASEVTLEG